MYLLAECHYFSGTFVQAFCPLFNCIACLFIDWFLEDLHIFWIQVLSYLSVLKILSPSV